MSDFCLIPDAPFIRCVNANNIRYLRELENAREEQKEQNILRAAAIRRTLGAVGIAVSSLALFALGALVASWI